MLYKKAEWAIKVRDLDLEIWGSLEPHVLRGAKPEVSALESLHLTTLASFRKVYQNWYRLDGRSLFDIPTDVNKISGYENVGIQVFGNMEYLYTLPAPFLSSSSSSKINNPWFLMYLLDADHPRANNSSFFALEIAA